MENFTYKDEYRYCYNACLNLTDACNLACRYCFVEQQPHFMTLDIAKDAVKFLVNNLKELQKRGLKKEKEKVSVTFFGGEPTLLFDEVIVPLTLWCEENYNDLITFSMTTNGTLLNEDRLKFMYDHKISPHLSIDGGPETQNYNRPCRDHNKNSFDLVVKNIPKLLEYFPNTCFRATISEEMVNETFNNYLFAIYMGFKNIFMMPDGRHKWSTSSILKLDEQFGKIYNFLLNNFREGNLPPIDFSSINKSFENVLKSDIKTLQHINEWENIPHSVIRCGLGTSGCAIGYDGTIYGCQEQPSQDSSNLFKIGNIYKNGIEANLHQQLLVEYAKPETNLCEDPELCINCPLRLICTNMACPSTSWSLFNTLHTCPISYCMWQRIMIHYAVYLMKTLTEENCLIFKQYLDKQCNYSKYFKEDKENEQ